MKRKKILVYYRYFGMTLGGGEYLPLTLIAELQKTCDVTLALDRTGNLERAVSLMGVAVDLSRLEVVKVMPPGYRKTSCTMFEAFLRSRKLKRLAKKADVCISLANIMDFGKPARHVLITIDVGDSAFDDFVAGRKASLARRIARFAKDRLLRPLLGMRSRRDVFADPRERIYPNSQYVKSLLESFYGKFNGRVFLPPTLFDGSACGVARDPLAVLFIGRIAQSKRIEEMMRIVEEARELTGKDLKLRLAGKMDDNPYSARLRALAATRPWISFEGVLYGDAKTRFLFSGAYALHVPPTEAFGISVTEYLKAGLVPVVADRGGAKEIVANPELEFSDPGEAARILAKLVSDAGFRREQKRRCAERAKAFTKEAYMAHQREIVAEMLDERPRPAR
ncbi:MAG: glycosyltransferase [Kiritimatiellae bacterium]|nr:glycosyltransferase [Kiritimatiellia bacterium]